jgi:glycosyltransferase involved in cell wall biosynthesis
VNGVHHVVLGRPEHGVTRLALQLLRPDDRWTAHAAPATRSAVEHLLAALPTPDLAPALHLHVTESLLGPDPVGTLGALARGRRLGITFHDVPQIREGTDRHARRLALYARLAEMAELVVVSAQHERRALLAAGIAVDAILPLPIDARRVQPAPEASPTVGVLGWIYPGKGHDHLLRLLAELHRPATLIAIGGPAVGHEGIERSLAELAARLGVDFRWTGYLDDEALLSAAARVRVPVCAHRHVSASGTMGSWMAAGRRALVADGAYARELDQRLPGALTVTAALGPAIAAALDDPASTVLADHVETGPTTAEAALAQAELLGRWVADTTERTVAIGPA